MTQPASDISVAIKAIIGSLDRDGKLLINTNSNSHHGNATSQSGIAYEEFIKLAFCSFSDTKNEILEWQGSANHFPDIIIRNGDAIEVKKVEAYSKVQLNSIPIHSSLLKNQCIKAVQNKLVEWQNNEPKNLVYCFLLSKDNRIHKMAFIHEVCLAHFDTGDLKDRISQSIKNELEKDNLSL